MIEGVIKIQESKKRVLYGVIYYGEKKEQHVPPHFILSKELDNKKCLFRKDKGLIVEIEVDGKRLQEKDVTQKHSYQSQGIHQRMVRNADINTVKNEYGGGQQEPISGKGQEFFLNPYNFLDVSGPTPRYIFKTNEKFHTHLNSGYIDVEIETVTPLFIPDPENSKFEEIIGDDGKPFKHKEMKFFKLNGKPAIPSTSLKGMLRSTIETLSNSCFPHDYRKNEAMNFMSHRLDVEQDSHKIRNLKAGLLKRRDDKWYFVELDMVKVLTVVDRFKGSDEDKTGYEKSIYFARNGNGEIEKISIKASTGGILGYIERKSKKRRFDSPIEIKKMKKDDFRVKEINGQKIDAIINRFNKTFPYIDLREDYGLQPAFYGIVRKKKEKWGGLYKLKEISLDLDYLKNRLKDYRDEKLNPDNYNVEYEVCRMYLKTSFDIETKTQDRLFFKFGIDNIDDYIQNQLLNRKAYEVGDDIIRRFKSVLAQRYENLKNRNENDFLLKMQPTSKDIKDGMLVYFSPEENPYLTYTQVARKPYRYGIADIIERMGKNFCTQKEKLCPACNMFGGVNIEIKVTDESKDENRVKTSKISIGGKVSLGFGECLHDNGFEEEVILIPLGEPKPSFYQFYVVDNRKSETSPGKSSSYDSPGIKLGRKVYLQHKIDNLDFRDNQKTKLNSTVQLLNPGAVFKSRISYFNLSHYELGLLLSSLPIIYNGERLDYQLGMGKPLGLGRVKIDSLKIIQIDRQKRYTSLKNNGESNMSNDEAAKYINIFQRCQVDVNKGIPFEKIGLNDKSIDSYEIKPVPDFEAISYIKEFKLIKSINNGIKLPYSIRYPIKLDKNEKDEKKKKKGFKWFMEEKKYADQRLFDPAMLGKPGDEIVKKEIPLFNWGQESEK